MSRHAAAVVGHQHGAGLPQRVFRWRADRPGTSPAVTGVQPDHRLAGRLHPDLARRAAVQRQRYHLRVRAEQAA